MAAQRTRQRSGSESSAKRRGSLAVASVIYWIFAVGGVGRALVVDPADLEIVALGRP